MRIVDQVWNEIFNDYPIVETVNENGIFKISSKEIKKYYEPRLVTKFDFSLALPNIMRENKIGILPDTTGTYLLGKFNVFKKFPEESTKVHSVSFPHWIESIDPNNINSEAIAITTALISPMFQDFFGDERLVGTVSGRMGSGQFAFTIGGQDISVNSSQIEIDGALESPERFVLLEGKNILHDDFIVRQLYYPFRTFKSRVNKPIHSVFMTYSNNVYRLIEYKFTDFLKYDSCEFVREKKYCIDLVSITLNDIRYVHELAGRFNHQENTFGAPFPQCDSFYRIINILENLDKRGEMTESDIAELFGFTPRQANYYFNGARYLGLVRKIRGIIHLTETGKELFNLKYKQRQLKIVEHIFTHHLFYDLFVYYLVKGFIERDYIKQKMREYNCCDESLIDRRSITVSSWMNWIIGLIGETED